MCQNKKASRCSPQQRLQNSKEKHLATFANGKRKYQQAAAYILMLNTGLRTGELLGLLNSDIDLERRVLHLERGVKESGAGMACKLNLAVM